MKMKKVTVVAKEDYLYTLEDSNKKRYEINIEFYDAKIDVGDVIFVDEKVLQEVNLYAYGPLKGEARVEDLIKIVKDNKDIYLQRYYG